MSYSKIKFLLVITIALTLTACSSIPISTLWKMRNFDPLTAEPEEIRVAVISDKIVQLTDRSTSITLGFKSDQAEHSFESISYATVTANARVEALEQYVNQNQAITLFYLDKEAAHNMRVAQQRLQNIKRNNVEGDGSLAVNINTGCFSGPKPNQLKASIYLLLKAEKSYIEIASDIDLLEQADREHNDFWLEC